MKCPQLHFDGQVWRPPYEASSQLLQLTSGCTWHKCKFFCRLLFVRPAWDNLTCERPERTLIAGSAGEA